MNKKKNGVKHLLKDNHVEFLKCNHIVELVQFILDL